jgi:hypothetical protein
VVHPLAFARWWLRELCFTRAELSTDEQVLGLLLGRWLLLHSKRPFLPAASGFFV